MMRSLTACMLVPVFAAVGAGPAVANDAPVIYRCESPRGQVSYGNSPCPAGTRAARAVDPEANTPIAAPSDKSAPADARAAGKIAPSKRATFDPWVEDRRLTEQIAQQRRACADLQRQISFLSRDLAGALPGTAASVELDLRRTQDQYLLQCGRLR